MANCVVSSGSSAALQQGQTLGHDMHFADLRRLMLEHARASEGLLCMPVFFKRSVCYGHTRHQCMPEPPE